MLSSTTRLPNSVGNYSIFNTQLLGKGATGSVYKGTHNLTKQLVAIKCIPLASIKDQATKSLLDNQKLALKTVKSPHLLKLEDIIEDSLYCYIITELCEGNTLKEYLAQHKTINQNEAMSIYQKILIGSLALTNQAIIHRDLKPGNIMFDGKDQVKIIDFGYCEIIMAKKVMKTFNVGSPSYMSPEAYSRTLYSQKSDAWSLGIILYEMLHGHPLDQGIQTKQYFQLLKTDSKFVQKRISTSINLQIRQILEKALKYLPEERGNISQLKYQVDKYHINLRQKNTNVHPVAVPVKTVKAVFSTSFQSKKPQVQSLKKMDNQNKMENKVENKVENKGFVSFNNFIQQKNKEKVSYLKMKQLTSLQEFDNDSKKNQNKSKGIAMDQKLNNFLLNTVKQPKSIKPHSTTNIKFCRANTFTASTTKQIPHQPSQPILKKGITVRFT